MARNEDTLIPEEYYAKFPSGLEDSIVIIVDPMLATGGSASAAITNIKARGAKDKLIITHSQKSLYIIIIYFLNK